VISLPFSSFGSGVEVLLGLDDGGLSAPMSYAADGGEATCAAVGDLNGDGLADIAAIEIGNVIILANDGDGGFATFMIPVPTGDGNGLFGIGIGDLNGDGLPDVAISAGTGASGLGIVVMINEGSFSFSAPTPIPSVTSGDGAFLVADLNGDGLADLVANTSDGSQLAVLLNMADGGFSEVDYPTSLPIRDTIASLPFGRAGAPDLVISGPEIVVLRNDGRGAFTLEQVSGAPGFPGFVVTGDFNADCIPDFAIMSGGFDCGSGSTDVAIFDGLADGGFDEHDIPPITIGPYWFAPLGPANAARAFGFGAACAGTGITVYGDASRH
jgi:hypothetical protein